MTKIRILLAHNSLYFPSHGGGDKSNRLLMEALAARGHAVEVVSRLETFTPEEESAYLASLELRGVKIRAQQNGVIVFDRCGVEVHTVTTNPNVRAYFTARITSFDPDVIITSTDDSAQLMFEAAVKSPRARIVYLIRATIAVPFGPHSAFPSPPRTELLRNADGIVGVSETVARYARVWAGLDAIHLPISLLEPGVTFPELGNFDSEFVTIANPCGVKGLPIFVALAASMPTVAFAAVPTWGASDEDMATLRSHPNIHILSPVDDIDDLLRRTRVMLVPSIWAEARSRMVLESMARGVPVMASKIGGLPEAKMGVPYLLPIHPVTRYKPEMDARMVPVAEIPPQDVAPWREALTRLVTDRPHFEEIARQSRAAALQYLETLTCERFEQSLEALLHKPIRRSPPQVARSAANLSSDRQRALALLIQQRKPRTWLHSVEGTSGKLRLFAFPHAGGSMNPYRGWREALAHYIALVPVRPDTSQYPTMDLLVARLAELIEPYLHQPFAFFGHSMGAIVAYELAQHLRRSGSPGPIQLAVSAARAPHYRLQHVPGPEPSDAAFVDQLRQLQGVPAALLDDANAMRELLPQLRNDASLYRRYVYSETPPLDVPIVAYGGDSDPNISTEHLSSWNRHTTREFRMRQFPGGHFYLDSCPEFLADYTSSIALASVMLTEEMSTKE